MKITLEIFDEIFLELSWTWLKDSEIKFLTNTGEISKKQQEEWFQTLSDRKDYFIWGIKADSIPVGACGLKNVANADCEYWGYIGKKDYWGKGIGKEMLFLMEERASILFKSSIWLRVIKKNTRAISLYKKQGYNTESETDTLFVMRKFL